MQQLRGSLAVKSDQDEIQDDAQHHSIGEADQAKLRRDSN